MNYIEQNTVYEKTTDSESYHGGYPVNQYINTDNSKYLGGNSKTTSILDDKVVPFGLFYHASVFPKPDETHIDGGFIHDSMFDKLLLSVGKIEKTGGKQKTRKKPANS